jgi:hypothetical protein
VALFQCKYCQINDDNLHINDLVGLGTDGASVMTGRKNGLVVRVKRLNNLVVGVHCAAHRCALASSQVEGLQSHCR